MVLQFGMTYLTILIQLKILKLLKWQKCGRSPFVIYRIQQCVKIRVLYNIFSYLEIFVWFGCKNFYLEVWRLTKAGLCQFFMKSNLQNFIYKIANTMRIKKVPTVYFPLSRQFLSKTINFFNMWDPAILEKNVIEKKMVYRGGCCKKSWQRKIIHSCIIFSYFLHPLPDFSAKCTMFCCMHVPFR